VESVELLKSNLDWLSDDQLNQLDQFASVFRETNAQINLVSRKDMDNFFTRHILHSLSIAQAIKFKPGAKVADVGTGGGLPGLPLAIIFPEAQFTLIDSIGKKVKAAQHMANELGITNVKTHWGRMEDVQDQFDFIVSRAVKPLPQMAMWLKGKFKQKSNHELPNGLLYIKGGDFQDDVDALNVNYRFWYLSDWFTDPFFETKKLVWLRLR
jgi:16S rRNA (guanine527-N7)-methyltransferase